MADCDWSELPKDLLELITSKIELPDYHRFGAVCKNWQSAANTKRYPPAKQLPWLLLGEDKKTKKRVFFSLSESKHYYMDIPELRGHVCRGSSFGWLFTVDRKFHANLLNPLTRECFKLPPLPDHHEHLKIKDFKAWQGRERDVQQRCIVSKAILSNNPSESPSRDNFTVVIIFGSLCTVAFWRPGDPKWSMLEAGTYGRMKEITFFRGNLYAFAGWYGFIVVDLASHHPTMKQVGPVIPGGCRSSEAYLVDFAGESLLLVHRIAGDEEDDNDDTDWGNEDVYRHFVTKELLVYEVDLERGTYCERGDIDGSAFFVGCGGSLVIADPSQVPGCVPDRISYSGTVIGYYGFDNTGFYDVVSQTGGTYGPSKHLIPYVLPPTWFTPNPW